MPGLTSEVSTAVHYTLPWRWADALHAVGCSALLYTARFDMDEARLLSGVGDGGPLGQLEHAEGP